MASSRHCLLASLLTLVVATGGCATSDTGAPSPSTPTTSASTATPAPEPTPAHGYTVRIPDLSGADIDCTRIGDPCEPGDDAELDQLWGACADGDGRACDRLYYDAPFDTRYEQFGNTCGDRDELVPCPNQLP